MCERTVFDGLKFSLGANNCGASQPLNSSYAALLCTLCMLYAQTKISPSAYVFFKSIKIDLIKDSKLKDAQTFVNTHPHHPAN